MCLHVRVRVHACMRPGMLYLDDVAEQFVTKLHFPTDVFVIDRDSGVVRVTGAVSVERQAHYTLSLVLTDGVYNSTVGRTLVTTNTLSCT